MFEQWKYLSGGLNGGETKLPSVGRRPSFDVRNARRSPTVCTQSPGILPKMEARNQYEKNESNDFQQVWKKIEICPYFCE